MPFGIGRRECTGQSLAKVMMFSFASILLHLYKIELPEGAEMPSYKVSTPQIITQPNDFQVGAKPRELGLLQD
jgi:cytochrome P450